MLTTHPLIVPRLKKKYNYISTPPPGLHAHLLTPRSRVLFEKLTGFAASQEIPRIYGTRKFITVLTSARHLHAHFLGEIKLYNY
jgi:hypothetical protein